MQLLSWAHKKLRPASASLKHSAITDADPFFENCAARAYTPNAASDRHLSTSSTHTEVLTIGTLGMGSLLHTNPDHEDDDDVDSEYDDDDDDDEVVDEEEEIQEMVAHNVTPNDEEGFQSPNNHRESLSSHTSESVVSSNRESVSSVDMHKLQEELHKILYLKLASHHGQEAGCMKAQLEGGKETRSKKHKSTKGQKSKDVENTTTDFLSRPKKQKSGKSQEGSDPAHVRARGSVREMMPLRKFLEFPMDEVIAPDLANKKSFAIQKKHYQVLMQSLMSKVLHHRGPTRVKVAAPSSLFEKLIIKPTLLVKRDLMHHVASGSIKVDKLLQMMKRVVSNKREGNRWTSRKGEGSMDNMREDAEQDAEGEAEELLKREVARSCRGSERFIEYMASKLAYISYSSSQYNEGDVQSCHIENMQVGHGHDMSSAAYNYNGRLVQQQRLQQQQQKQQVGADHQLIAAYNGCWIKTDDEYLVLEL